MLFVDPEVQRGLLIRVGFYGAIVLCYFAATMWITSWVDASDGVSIGDVTLAWASDMTMWLPTSLIIFPLAGFDLLRFSYRFVAPALRLREQLRSLAAGHDAQPISMHEDGIWQDAIKEFNELREEVVRLRKECSSLAKLRGETLQSTVTNS